MDRCLLSVPRAVTSQLILPPMSSETLAVGFSSTQCLAQVKPLQNGHLPGQRPPNVPSFTC